MPEAPASPLVAADANVLMDLGGESEIVIDALTTLRQRLRSPRIVIPPTAQQELVHIARHGDSLMERDQALAGIEAAQRWHIVPVNLMPVGHGIVDRIAERLRGRGLLPPPEVNDSLLVAESALLGAGLLLSSDKHLTGMDFERVSIALQEFDLSAPVIATPSEVVRKFFHW